MLQDELELVLSIGAMQRIRMGLAERCAPCTPPLIFAPHCPFARPSPLRPSQRARPDAAHGGPQGPPDAC